MGKYDHYSCSGRTWTTRRRGDIDDFNRWYTKGKAVWVVNEHSTKIAAQFEAATCSRVTSKGGGLFGTEGKNLLKCYGQVFETQPRGLRDLASPEPDCRNEGWASPDRGGALWGAIHTDDIKKLEYEADRAKDQYDADRKAGRRGGKWFS